MMLCCRRPVTREDNDTAPSKPSEPSSFVVQQDAVKKALTGEGVVEVIGGQDGLKPPALACGSSCPVQPVATASRAQGIDSPATQQALQDAMMGGQGSLPAGHPVRVREAVEKAAAARTEEPALQAWQQILTPEEIQQRTAAAAQLHTQFQGQLASQGSSQPRSSDVSSTWQPILSEPATQASAGLSPPAAHMSTPQAPRAAERLGSFGKQSQRDSPGCAEAVERLSGRSRESPHAAPATVDRRGSRVRESSPKGCPRPVERMGIRGQGRQSSSPRSAAAAAAERQWELSLEERLYSEHRQRLYQGQAPEVKPGSAMLDDSDEEVALEHVHLKPMPSTSSAQREQASPAGTDPQFAAAVAACWGASSSTSLGADTEQMGPLQCPMAKRASNEATPASGAGAGTGTLYARLGGSDAVEAAVDLFYDKLLSDRRLAPFFEGVNMMRLVVKQIQFLVFAFGGLKEYKGRDLREAHYDLVMHKGLDLVHFDLVAHHFRQTLEDLKVAKADIGEAMATLATVRDYFDPATYKGIKKPRTSQAKASILANPSGIDQLSEMLPASKAEQVLVQKAGSKGVVMAAVRVFYLRVMSDPGLRPFFQDIALTKLKNKLVSFLAFAFAPSSHPLQQEKNYRGKELALMHAHMLDHGLSMQHFDAVILHFSQTLKQLNIDAVAIDEAVRNLTRTRSSFADMIERGQHNKKLAPRLTSEGVPALPTIDEGNSRGVSSAGGTPRVSI